MPKSSLIEIGLFFAKEFDRSLKIIQHKIKKDKPEKKNVIDLERLKQACRELDIEPIIPEALVERYREIINSNDVKTVANIFPSGKAICLAVIPFTTSGIPLQKREIADFRYFYILKIGYQGITEGFSFNPGYYYDLLPKEIQEQCTFNVPIYENELPNKKEIEIINNAFLTAINNLKQLLEAKDSD